MSEGTPKFTPEEKKLHSERGGYVSGQSRRGEIERGESGKWELTKKGEDALREKALEEQAEINTEKKEKEPEVEKIEEKAEAPEAPKETVEAAKESKIHPDLEYLAKEAKEAGGVTLSEHFFKKEAPAVEAETEKEAPDEALKNAYFEWRDLERKAKGGSAWRLHADQEKVLVAEAAKEKYHKFLIEKSEVSEKEKPFYLPPEMVPEGGPRKYNIERLEKIVGMELGLQKEYEKRFAAESKENPGLLKKLWRNYSKMPKGTRIALGVGIATGVFILTGPAVGLWAAGSYGVGRLARSVVGGFVAGAVYKGLDKLVGPFVDSAAKKNIEKTKQKQAEMLNDIRISGVQNELLFAKENTIREYARIARQKQRINIEKALIAGALGVGASFAVEPSYEYLAGKPSAGGLIPPETGENPVIAPELEREATVVPPVAGKTVEVFQQEQYSAIIDRGGNVWKAAKEVAKQAGLSDKQFGESWHNSFVDIPGRGMVHISEINLVHPGTEVYWDGETESFYVKGERMGPTKVSYETSTETVPERPFGHLPVEEAPEAGSEAPTFAELEKGYPGTEIDTGKFVSDRLASFGIDESYYDQIKNSKVKDLLKIRKGTFWDLFRHLNDETAGRVDIYAEWKLAVMVKTELKNLLPLVEDKTIDEAIKFAAQNRHLIK